MNHRIWPLLLVGVALAALNLVAHAQSAVVGVRVVDGQVRVLGSQTGVSSSSPAITWQLQTPGYRFTSRSVDFGDDAPFFRCAVADDGQSIRCTRSPKAPAGNSSYTISLEATTAPPADASEPTGVIMSD